MAPGHPAPRLVSPTLWAEGYDRSLVDADGPWAGFARATVDDWLGVLATAQPPDKRATPAGRAQCTLVLAVLRGALLDLLATGDVDRTTAAVHALLAALDPITAKPGTQHDGA